MATTYTSLLGLALPTTGELQGTWGDTVNNSITSLLDSAVAGTTTLSTDGDVTLTTTTGAANQARQAILLCSGARTAQRTITAPAQSKIYTVINATSGGFAVKLVGVGPTTGVTIPAGSSGMFAWNGSDFVDVSNYVNGNKIINGNLTVNGNTTLGDASGDSLTINAGTVTLNQGTANGVAYLNGSKVLTTGSALTFDGTNLSNAGRYIVTANSAGVTDVSYGRYSNGAWINTPSATVGYLAIAGGSAFAWDSSNLISYIGGSEQMRLTSTGLGIGTSSPAYKLVVAGTAPRIVSQDTTNNYITVLRGGNSSGYVGTEANIPFQIVTNSNTVATFDTSGNLGLGVTPSAWSGSYKAGTLNLAGGNSLASESSNQYDMIYNAYLTTASGWVRVNADYASIFQQSGGAFTWYSAASAAAGSAVSFSAKMTLDASGRLGIGQTSPFAPLVVVGADFNAYFTRTTSSSSEGVAIGGSSGLGRITSNGAIPLTFEINGTERARIDSSGNLLVGSSSVISGGAGSSSGFQVVKGTIRLGVFDNNDGGVWATFSGSKSIGMCAGTEGNYAGGAGQAWIKFTPSGLGSANIVAQAGSGGVQVTSGATSWSSYSDIRLKDVTGGFVDALSSIAQLEPIKFTWKSDENKKPCVGISAQSVQSVLPEAVDEFVMPDTEDATAYLTIRYTELIPLLTAAIQEQQAIIEQLTSRIAALETK